MTDLRTASSAELSAIPADAVWLSPQQVGVRLPGVTVNALRDMRANGNGPAFYKPSGKYGKVTLYSVKELDAWVARGRQSTTEQS